MSGHSKWATIKRKKGAQDAKRGKLFSKLIREITVAAREGGGDPEANLRLKNAIEKARANNMPLENIERAIRRATGEDSEAAAWEEVTYEGYGPGKVAILVEALTDNKNRTAADIRHIFTRAGGKLSGAGTVSYLFTRKGLIQISKDVANEEKVLEAAMEAGAEDVQDGGETYDIYTDRADFEKVKSILKEHGLTFENAELIMVPSSTVKLQGKDAESVLRMVAMLEDHDDVQSVWANFDIDASEMEAFQE